MKKSLSRVLSLALVLVMVLGMMPMALADETTQKEPSPGGVVSFEADGEIEVGKSGSVSVTGFTTGGGTTLNDEQLAAASATLEVVSGAGVIEVSGLGYTGKAVGTATLRVNVTFEGETKINTGSAEFTVNVKAAAPAAPVYTVEATGATYKISDKTAKVSAVVKDAEGKVVEGAKVAWTADLSGVTVAEDGTVSVGTWPDADKSVTLTATYTYPDPADSTKNLTKTDTCTLALVVSGVYVKADNFSMEVGDTEVLSFQLAGVTADSDITWSITASGKEIELTKSAAGKFYVTGEEAGEAKIEISATYKGREYTKVVYVGVYEEHEMEVTLKSSVTKFTFDDEDVFASAYYDGHGYAGRSIAYMIRETDGYYGAFDVSALSDKVATLSVGISGSDALVYITGLKQVSVSLNGLSGQYIVDYELQSDNGVKVAVGTITINTDGHAGDIIYKTNLNGQVVLEENDFATYFKKNVSVTTNPGTLSHVVFDLGSELGTFYTSSSKKEMLLRTDECAYNYSSTVDEVDLDAVTYVPYSRAGKAYVDKITFTCYSTTYGVSVTGTLAIDVSLNLPFTDVSKTDWFYENVSYMYNNGYMNGTSDTKFSPNDTLTRGMVVTMLYRVHGEPTVNYTSTFTDLKQDWYKDAVAWAARNGIVNGFDTKTFGPDRAITREQLAAILYRYADYIKDSTYSNQSLTGFTDYRSVSSYATDAMEWAVYEGIITGSAGKLMPTGSATRAQAAAMFHRFLED